ncbi:MAG: acetyl-CoA carboxylase biotin carboxyl carrier protein [Phycisphaerales bacterium]
MIDIRKLKELVRLMVENDLTELDLQDQEETVSLKRGGAGGPVVWQQPMVGAAPAMHPYAAPGSSIDDDTSADQGDAGDTAGLIPVESPMVGTFYASPNPESPAFVKVGDSVSSDTVVCLVEAMKVFNEIKAETTGTVARCLVENGQAVEFGQPLFMIKPN